MPKAVIVDAKGHMLGRLASIVAKEVLNGNRVVVVRCEEINISGSLFRNRLKYTYAFRKHMNSNPTRGPFHFRAPSKILLRTIRGMVPHKTERGSLAMHRVRTFEGVPHPFDKRLRVVVPDALKNLRLKPGRKFCRLGDLATQMGWRHNDLIARLEDARKVRGQAFVARKKAATKVRKTALKNVEKEIAPIQAELAKLGYPAINA